MKPPCCNTNLTLFLYSLFMYLQISQQYSRFLPALHHTPALHVPVLHNRGPAATVLQYFSTAVLCIHYHYSYTLLQYYSAVILQCSVFITNFLHSGTQDPPVGYMFPMEIYGICHRIGLYTGCNANFGMYFTALYGKACWRALAGKLKLEVLPHNDYIC